MAIAIHLSLALVALILGAIVLARPKGTAPHKALGRAWVAIMIIVSVSSFWIPAFGRLGWIHLLTGLTLVSLTMAVWHIRNGRARHHRGWMIGAYGGLVGAGIFAAAIPDRVVGGFLVRLFSAGG